MLSPSTYFDFHNALLFYCVLICIKRGNSCLLVGRTRKVVISNLIHGGFPPKLVCFNIISWCSSRFGTICIGVGMGGGGAMVCFFDWGGNGMFVHHHHPRPLPPPPLPLLTPHFYFPLELNVCITLTKNYLSFVIYQLIILWTISIN